MLARQQLADIEGRLGSGLLLKYPVHYLDMPSLHWFFFPLNERDVCLTVGFLHACGHTAYHECSCGVI